MGKGSSSMKKAMRGSTDCSVWAGRRGVNVGVTRGGWRGSGKSDLGHIAAGTSRRTWEKH